MPELRGARIQSTEPRMSESRPERFHRHGLLTLEQGTRCPGAIVQGHHQRFFPRARDPYCTDPDGRCSENIGLIRSD